MANVFGYSQVGAAPANMVTTNTAQIISGTKTFTSDTNTYYGDGSNLTGVTASAPSNMVTTDTTQTIAAIKTFSNVSNIFYGDGANLTGVTASAPSNMVTTDTTQTITGAKTMNNTLVVSTGTGAANTTVFTAQQDSATQQGIKIAANLVTAPAFNTLAQANDAVLYAFSATGVNTKNFTIGTQTTNSAGIRFTPTSVLLGAGSSSSTPTNYLFCTTTEITVVGTTSFSSNVNFNNGLTIPDNRFILKSGTAYTIPTQPTQIGFREDLAINATASTLANTLTLHATLSNCPAGLWLYEFGYGETTATTCYMSLSDSSTVLNTKRMASSASGANKVHANCSTTVEHTNSTGTLYVLLQSILAIPSNNWTNIFVSRTRLN